MTTLDPRALKAARSAYQSAIPDGCWHTDGGETDAPIRAAITAYLALSQPQAGEPVAVGYVDPADTARKSSVGEPLRFWCSPVKTTCFSMPLYASPQPANPAQVTDARYDSVALEAARDIIKLTRRGEFDDQLKAKIQGRIIEAIAAAIGADGQAVAEPRKGFPILGSGGQKIDWQLVADHEKQAQANHYQSVERLAARGGLAWTELYAVLHNKKWQKMDENDAITACRSLEARYLSALSQPHPADERLGRFGHHPDPAIDFEVEVGAIEAELLEARGGPFDQIKERIDCAMTFRVGGDEISIKAKQTLRDLEKQVMASIHPADERVVEALPRPDAVSMTCGTICLEYTDRDERDLAFDWLEAHGAGDAKEAR